MSDNREAILHLKAATEALAEDPITKANQVLRRDELNTPEYGLWAHVKKVSGGYWLTLSSDPIQGQVGMFVPDHPGRMLSCGDLDEVFDLLRERFG